MIAYLIIAHKNVEQLNLLIDAISNDDSLIFIHCDANWNLNIGEIKKNKNVIVLDNRIHGVLFGYSLVQIELNLLSKAFEFGKKNNLNIQYFALLSGQDYPVQNIQLVQNELTKMYPKPILDCTPRGDSNWLSKRAKHTHFFAKIEPSISSFANKRTKIIRRCIKLPIYLLDKIMGIFNTTQKDLDANGYKLFGGSQWWILPDIIIQDILNQMETHSTLFEICSHIYGPDETFFQTLIMNSKYKDLVEINDSMMVSQNNKTFSFFRKPGFPVTGHPYVLTMNEFDLLCENLGGHYFARKFDINIDKEIIEQLHDKIGAN